MTLRSVDIAVFGALRDLSLEFGQGMNVVVGENETGKSTLFAALRHSLLTPTDLTKSQFARRLGRYLPRPDGTVLEARVVLEVDEELTLLRRWGDEPSSVLIAADGARITGSAVDRRLEKELPVRHGTYSALFLVDQAQLDATHAQLGESVESRDEIAELLRRTRTDTGGVSVEAFRRGLDDRLKKAFGRWDRDRDRPEGGRGLERPWTKEVGEVLAAYYAVQRVKLELEETVRAEQELDTATMELEQQATELRLVELFLSDNRQAYDALRNVEALDREIAVQGRYLADIRSAVRRWPVVDEELAREARELASAQADVSSGEARLAEVADRRVAARRRALYERASKAESEVVTARERVEAIAPVAEELVAELRRVEADRSELRARLSVGSLRARIVGRSEVTLSVGADDEPETTIDLGSGDEAAFEAHRRFVFSTADLSLEIESGEESFADLRSRYEEVDARVATLGAQLQARTAEEATLRRNERTAAERELAAAGRRFAEALGDEEMEALRSEFSVAPGHEIDRPAPGEEVAIGDERAAVQAVSGARERLGAAQSALRSLEQEATALAAKYESQDALEDELARARRRLSELETDRSSAGTVPDGFDSAAGFLAEYREREHAIESLRVTHHESRVRQAAMLARLPERTGEEVAQLLADSEREYERARRHGGSLARLELAVNETIAEQRENPFAPYSDRVSWYLRIISAEEYAVADSLDPLLPARFRRARGPELDYVLLSQGTRDVVALAIRLALAETALQGAQAPLLLDDPLVDMDPRRRSGAARAIEHYASVSQVILFTCHPDHAGLFADAHLIDLDRATAGR